jgi:hypothetical protein
MMWAGWWGILREMFSRRRDRSAADRSHDEVEKTVIVDREVVGHGYFVEVFAQHEPTDRQFSFEERLKAFDRAVKASGLSGLICTPDFDVLYQYYRQEIELLKKREQSSKGHTKH